MSILPFPGNPSSFPASVQRSDSAPGALPAELFEAFHWRLGAVLQSGMAATDFEQFERDVVSALHGFGREILHISIERLDDGAASLTRDGRVYTRVEATSKTIMTSVGQVSFWRSRYRRAGEASVAPVDEKLGLAEAYFTPLGACQSLYLLSGNTARDCVAQQEMFGIGGASVSSLQRLGKAAAEHWEEVAEEAIEEIRSEEGVPASAASACVSLDGVMAPMRPGEGEDRKTVYREASCGSLTYYDEAGERLHSVYFGRMAEPGKATLKEELAAEVAGLVGRRPDLRIVGIADAAPDNWSFLGTLVAEECQLVDYWHACQHLQCVADAAFGGGAAAGAKWFEKYKAVLRDDEDGVEKVIDAIRYRLRRAGAAKAEVKRELRFFRKHRRRMRYAAFHAKRLPIGSGVIEATCKSLVSARMKKAGQRWGHSGGQAILTFRSLVKSERFDRAWRAIVARLKGAAIDNGAAIETPRKAA